jgi:uncharacterized protein YprB with RNaseH-like and TPR domain
MSTTETPGDESSKPRPGEGSWGLESLRRKVRARREQPAGPQPPAGAGNVASGPGIIYARSVPRTQVRPSSYAPPGRFLPLADAVRGQESRAPEGPPYHRVEEALETVHPQLAAYCRGELLGRPHRGLFDGARMLLRRSLDNVGGGGPVSLRDLVFLDLETTGLSSSPLFLIGTLVAEGGGFVIRHFLARTYAEERSVISAFAEDARPRRFLVSFNGRCFDVPYLRARAAATGVAFVEPATHVDLLPAARRVYGPQLPDCRLKTLERSICKRHRAGDIPGEHIPEAYHYFVRTGNAVQLADILRHNAWDLVTLLELMVRMTAGGAPGQLSGAGREW